MMNRLTSRADTEDARRRVEGVLDGRGEWFCTEGLGGRAVALRRGEWEVRASGRALLFTYWGEAGARAWRVSAWVWDGERLRLEATRRAGAVRATLELVPRASARAAKAVLAAARQAACGRLARLVCETLAGAKVESARLSAGARRGEPGRYARILLRRGGARVAATGPVVELRAEDADAFLSSALIWFARVGERRCRGVAGPPTELCLVASPPLARTLARRAALLREDLRRALTIYETGEEARALSATDTPTLEDLLAEAPRFTHTPPAETSGLAARVLALAPEAVDVARSRHGETLRFRGLAFARVRSVLGREHAWFGVEGMPKRLLTEESWPEFLKLLDELAEHRRADAGDRRHALFRAAPEAWLESLLRRDVTRLDPGLRLAPLHAQFRTSRAPAAGQRPVDLLALRRDGRLVVIELKVSEDAAHALQAADYWRRVETLRRRGHVRRARLFGDAEIADGPPLVYAVAPLLRHHRAFDSLARALRREIETYRFDLCEDWRAGVRVARRGRVV